MSEESDSSSPRLLIKALSSWRRHTALRVSFLWFYSHKQIDPQQNTIYKLGIFPEHIIGAKDALAALMLFSHRVAWIC